MEAVLSARGDTLSWEAAVKAQGWYRDPYRLHEDRYFSDGQPSDGDDLRRADDPSAGPVTSDERPFWAVLGSAAVWGPTN